MKQIKAVGFDFGGVIGGDPNIGHEFTQISARLLGISPERWRQTYFSLNHLLNTGKTSKREFWRQFLVKFNQLDKLSEFLEHDQVMAERYLVINQQVMELIDHLREKGYKVGLLSNATQEVASNIKNLQLAHHFDSFLFSADIKLQKPDPQAFISLAESLEVSVTELVFIDDAAKSLVTAPEVGFNPILFRSHPQLVRELTDLKVL